MIMRMQLLCRTIAWTLGRARRALVAAALVQLAIVGAAHALDASCPRNELIAGTVQIAKTANDAVRMSTAKTLIESWQFSLPELMREIAQMKRTPPSSWTKAELDWNVGLTRTVKTILETFDQSIPLFRKCRDDAVIKPLVWAARGDDKVLRLNTANILANVIDNTTVCFVLHHLDRAEPALGDDGRANLLGITRAMASYAYQDNAEQIQRVINGLRTRLGDRIKDLPQTAALITNIAGRVQNSENRSTRLPADLQRYCKDYPYDSALD
jgi:hypothetical protein